MLITRGDLVSTYNTNVINTDFNRHSFQKNDRSIDMDKWSMCNHHYEYPEFDITEGDIEQKQIIKVYKCKNSTRNYKAINLKTICNTTQQSPGNYSMLFVIERLPNT